MVTLMRHKIQSNLYADNTAVSKYKVLKLLNLLLINNSLSDISFSCTVETLVMFLGLDGIFFLSSCMISIILIDIFSSCVRFALYTL